MSKIKRNKIAYKNKDESKSFDLYIKKLDDGLLDNITNENLNQKTKIQKRKGIESNLILHHHSNLSQRRLDKKAYEIESKENQITQAQQELELKNQKLIKELETKNNEINQLKIRNTQLLLENTNLNSNSSLLHLKNEELKKTISELSISISKIKATNEIIKSERYSSESDDAIKDMRNMKKVIQIQKERIKALENELKNTIINSHKEKEGMYAKRIDALEKINKELLLKINNNTGNSNGDYQHQFKDQLCLLLLKEKNKHNDTNGNNNNGSIGNNRKNKIFTFKNGSSNSSTFAKREKLERLIKEKDVLLSNGNYSSTDALILLIDEKINKLLENINV